MNDEQQRPQQPEPAQPQPTQQEAAPAEEPQGPPQAGWGAPPPPPPAKTPRWSVRHTIIAAAIALVAAAAAGGTVYAVSDASADDRDSGPQAGPREPGELRVGPMQGGPMGDAEHGQFQHGEVTAISDDSITVESDDGYSGTYVIDSDTELTDGVEKGDEVMVTATTGEGEEATATMIAEPGEGQPPRRIN